MGDIGGTLKNNERLARRKAEEAKTVAGEASILTKDAPVALLLVKLEAWMTQQPEWLTIVAMERSQRRAAMRELANRLYTIPIMDGTNTVPRQVRRKAAKALGHAAKTGQLTEQVKAALVKAALEEEARASVAMDGETVAVEGPVEGTGEPLSDVEPNPDPEGDVKADVEAAKAAEEEKTDA